MSFRLPSWLLAIPAFLFLLLGIGLLPHKAPWCDEGWFLCPAHQIAMYGTDGTPPLEPTGHYLDKGLVGIESRTLVVPPLHLWLLAACFRTFGVSLDVARIYGLLWGVAGLLVLAGLVHWTWRRPALTFLATFLMSIDLVYLWGSVDARMDIQGAVLGWSAWLIYLRFGKSNLAQSILFANIALALALLHHPNGLFAGVVLWAVILMKDRKRLRLPLLAAASLPFFLAGLAWLYFIWPDFGIFQIQFTANAAGRGNNRISKLLEPWTMAYLEVIIRYLTTYGFNSMWIGVVPSLFRAVPAIYAVTALFLIAKRRTLLRGRARILMLLCAGQVLTFTFLIGYKAQNYLIYLTPLWAIALAWVLLLLWSQSRASRIGALSVFALFLCAQLTTYTFKIQESQRTQGFVPARDYLKRTRAPGETLWAPTYWGLDDGFTGYREDIRLGFYTGKRAQWIVRDHWHEYFEKLIASEEPKVHAHIQALFKNEYSRVARFGEYSIYRRKVPEKANQMTKEKTLDIRSNTERNIPAGFSRAAETKVDAAPIFSTPPGADRD